MGTTFGGRSCCDPARLHAECIDRNLPTDWWGEANRFAIPLGRDPGRGAILLRKRDLDALDPTADHELVFSGGFADRRYPLKAITLLGATCLSPGHVDDAQAVFLCELADRRHFLLKNPIDRAFNVVLEDGTGYASDTTDGGTPWTWQGVVNEIVSLLDLSGMTFPPDWTLPFTPHGTPQNFTFWGDSAWAALSNVLDRLACAARYDPERDTFTVVRLGVADPIALTAMGAVAAGAGRLWDDYPQDPDRGWRPEKVRVRFIRYPRPGTISTSPYYTVDVTLPAAAGVKANTYVTLDDDNVALAATGTPSNSATLATRADERASDWLRKRAGFERPLRRVYQDFDPEIPGQALGSTAGEASLTGDGGLMRTEICAHPDGRLEGWEPLSVLPPWFPPRARGGRHAVLTTKHATSPFWKWQPLTISQSGGVSLGTESTEFNAFPLSALDNSGADTWTPTGGKITQPYSGMRVWLWDSDQTILDIDGVPTPFKMHEFLPRETDSGFVGRVISGPTSGLYTVRRQIWTVSGWAAASPNDDYTNCVYSGATPIPLYTGVATPTGLVFASPINEQQTLYDGRRQIWPIGEASETEHGFVSADPAQSTVLSQKLRGHKQIKGNVRVGTTAGGSSLYVPVPWNDDGTEGTLYANSLVASTGHITAESGNVSTGISGVFAFGQVHSMSAGGVPPVAQGPGGYAEANIAPQTHGEQAASGDISGGTVRIPWGQQHWFIPTPATFGPSYSTGIVNVGNYCVWRPLRPGETNTDPEKLGRLFWGGTGQFNAVYCEGGIVWSGYWNPVIEKLCVVKDENGKVTDVIMQYLGGDGSRECVTASTTGCCPDGSGGDGDGSGDGDGDGATSWNCVDGSCVEVEGTGGAYPTRAACLDACIDTGGIEVTELAEGNNLHGNGPEYTVSEEITVTVPEGDAAVLLIVDAAARSRSGTTEITAITTTFNGVPLNLDQLNGIQPAGTYWNPMHVTRSLPVAATTTGTLSITYANGGGSGSIIEGMYTAIQVSGLAGNAVDDATGAASAGPTLTGSATGPTTSDPSYVHSSMMLCQGAFGTISPGTWGGVWFGGQETFNTAPFIRYLINGYTFSTDAGETFTATHAANVTGDGGFGTVNTVIYK